MPALDQEAAAAQHSVERGAQAIASYSEMPEISSSQVHFASAIPLQGTDRHGHRIVRSNYVEHAAVDQLYSSELASCAIFEIDGPAVGDERGGASSCVVIEIQLSPELSCNCAIASGGRIEKTGITTV